MIRTFAKSVVPALSLLPKRAILAAVRPSYLFSNQIEASSKLKAILHEEIKHQEQNQQDLTPITSFFENLRWKISYDGIQVQLSKQAGPYDVRLIFNAKTPMPDNEEQGQENQQAEQEQNDDFTEITAYIKKEGNSKWLTIDFMVLGQRGENQITYATFVPDFEVERVNRKKNQIISSGYNGPDVSSLDERLHENLVGFVESIGITSQVLQQASQFSLAYEHQFYIQWLKDLKNIV